MYRAWPPGLSSCCSKVAGYVGGPHQRSSRRGVFPELPHGFPRCVVVTHHSDEPSASVSRCTFAILIAASLFAEQVVHLLDSLPGPLIRAHVEQLLHILERVEV